MDILIYISEHISVYIYVSIHIMIYVNIYMLIYIISISMNNNYIYQCDRYQREILRLSECFLITLSDNYSP